MIVQSAVDRYLERELDSFRWMKKLSHKTLLKTLAETNTPIKPDGLWNHQIAMILLGIYFPKFLFFSSLGCGKTRTTIELIRHWQIQNNRNQWLVCVPDKVGIQTWQDELTKFGTGLAWISLEDSKTRSALLEHGAADIYLIHYPGLVRFCCNLQDTNHGKHRFQLHPPVIKTLQNKFTGIVFDESTALGNHASLTSKICAKVAQTCTYRYALTGTPFGRDPMPLWNQFKTIDDGETLGPTLGLFRAVFYKESRNFWGGMDYKFKKDRTKALHQIIAHRSIVYTAEECSDLPERVHIKKTVFLPDNVEAYYQTELQTIRSSKGNFRVLDAAFLRMRQVASGFLGLKNDETGAKAEIEFPENPKLDALMTVIAELPATAKLVIYYEYIWTGNQIAKRLAQQKLKHQRLQGGQKDPKGALREFLSNPDCRLLLANNKYSLGLNLQVAHYLCFVESPIRPIIRQQAEGRIRRSGQTAPRVFIIDLITRSLGSNHSIDARILEWLDQGKNLLDMILQGEWL